MPWKRGSLRRLRVVDSRSEIEEVFSKFYDGKNVKVGTLKFIVDETIIVIATGHKQSVGADWKDKS